MSDLISRPYRPSPKMCCEACVFGRGPHSPWCEKLIVFDGAKAYDEAGKDPALKAAHEIERRKE